MTKGKDLWSLYEEMVKNDVKRAYVVYEDGQFKLSHPDVLKGIQDFFESSPDFNGHEGVFIGREEAIHSLFFAFIHNTHLGLAQGGLRFWKYETLEDLMADGLRLAQGMSRKNAMASLWWGGGKGIIPLPPGKQNPDDLNGQERRPLFEAYGRFVASLGGVYYTAEDVGTKTQDMEVILSQNRFTTCLPKNLGGSGNPSPFTAEGVFRSMKTAWKFLYKTDNFDGVKVAVQGVGNVGKPIVEKLLDAGAHLWITDITEKVPLLQKFKEERKDRTRIHIVEDPASIFHQDVDIFCPCACGAVINSDTIKQLKAKLVCGAANNILKDDLEDAKRLYHRNIDYVPDYVSNCMGIINCSNEWMGYMEEDVLKELDKVEKRTLQVLKRAKKKNITTVEAANQVADEILNGAEKHPLSQMIGRGKRIIKAIIESQWAK